MEWIGYMELIDFETERGQPREGDSVFASVEQLLGRAGSRRGSTPSGQ